MNETVKKDLPFVQRACEKILQQFPHAPLCLYWWDMTDTFVIATIDRELYDSKKFSELVYKLNRELLHQTYNGVDFIDFYPLGNKSSDPNCIEFDIKQPAKSREDALTQ